MVFTASESIVVMAHHDGHKLRAELARIGRSPADFARAAGVSRTAVDRWLNTPDIGRVAWRTIRPALVRVGIEPATIKPNEPAPEAEVDLRPLIHDFTVDQMRRLLEILSSDRLPRDKLEFFIDGKLSSKK